MWYVIQTMTGQEEKLVRMIRKIVPRKIYSDCFVAYYERVWKKQQQSVIHIERLFPGYVFIITEEPEDLYFQLKNVLAMSKLISDGSYDFLPIEREEEEFLQDVMSEDHVIHLSLIEKDEDGHICRVAGPIGKYKEHIVKFQYKKRYALTRIRLLGREKVVALGILLKEDVKGQALYGSMETMSGQALYRSMETPAGADSRPLSVRFSVGDPVKVVAGEFAGASGVVWRVKKNAVCVGIQMFGQSTGVEFDSHMIRRTDEEADLKKRAAI